MKAILFVFSLLFSINAFSANAYLDPNGYGWDYVYNGGIAGGGYTCGPSSCSGQQSKTFSYNGIYYNTLPEDNAEYFYLESDISTGDPNESVYKALLRNFVAGQDFITTQAFDYTVTYDSFGLESLQFFIDGFFDLTPPSGSFIGSTDAGKKFSIAMVGLLSNAELADDAFLTFELTINPVSTSEVPLPTSLFLLAPALFGFMGLRRKLS